MKLYSTRVDAYVAKRAQLWTAPYKIVLFMGFRKSRAYHALVSGLISGG